jgi:hyperosmotically inducible periplasmic protein
MQNPRSESLERLEIISKTKLTGKARSPREQFSDLKKYCKGEIEMKSNTIKLQPLLPALGALTLGATLLIAPVARPQDDNQPAAPDDTKQNKDQSGPTADQQKMNPSDRAITQKIRKAIHEDSSLSTYAHNIKVITQDGKVTLRGPVRSDDEKANLEAKAIGVVGQDNVTDQLQVAPGKN